MLISKLFQHSSKHNVIRYIILKLGILAFIAAAFVLSNFIRNLASIKVEENEIPTNTRTHPPTADNSIIASLTNPIDALLQPKPDNSPTNIQNYTPPSEEEASVDTPSLENVTSYDITIKKGDTLLKILQSHGTNKEDIKKLLIAINKHKDTISLTIGKNITLTYEIEIIENDGDLTTEHQSLKEIIIQLNATRQVTFTKQNDIFVIEKQDVKLSRELARRQSTINGSLMSTLKNMGIKSGHIIELINAYSYQIDFQRQIRNGDSVAITFEKFFTDDKKFSHYGKIIHASLNLSGKVHDIFRYKPSKKSSAEFFTPEGKGVKRSLLRTPIKVVRISSKYGKRKHPTLGYTKMHTGVDFAAPTGTPIYAAGSGVITKIGWNGGYGRFIQIKHNGTLSTAYGHASKFAKNLKKGSRVKQGQIIAYVGKTGRATGPHLHYEIRVNGKHVNPMKYKTTAGKELKDKELADFKVFQKDIRKLNEQLLSSNVIENKKIKNILNKAA